MHGRTAYCVGVRGYIMLLTLYPMPPPSFALLYSTTFSPKTLVGKEAGTADLDISEQVVLGQPFQVVLEQSPDSKNPDKDTAPSSNGVTLLLVFIIDSIYSTTHSIHRCRRYRIRPHCTVRPDSPSQRRHRPPLQSNYQSDVARSDSRRGTSNSTLLALRRRF